MTDPSLAAIDRAMNRIRRSQTRRTLGKLAEQQVCDRADWSLVPVLDVIAEGAGGQEVSVGLVGERLGLDPSRASRLVATAIQAGYVARVASQCDGRRIHLELTDLGRTLSAQGQEFRQGILANALEGWTAEDRAQLATLLTRFTDDLGTAGPPADCH